MKVKLQSLKHELLSSLEFGADSIYIYYLLDLDCRDLCLPFALSSLSLWKFYAFDKFVESIHSMPCWVMLKLMLTSFLLKLDILFP